MVIENEYVDLTRWSEFASAGTVWLRVVLILLLVGLAITYVATVIRQIGLGWAGRKTRAVNPFSLIVGSLLVGIPLTLRSTASTVLEVLTLPLGYRRIGAVAWLSVKEAVRRRVLYVLILFLAPFLFAGWYLPKTQEGELLYLVGFVNTAIGWLLLPMVLFIVGLSIPNDIRSKTIYTIVTKPIRLLELIVGRIIGFMIVFTLVIAVMGGVSLLYISNQVSQPVFDAQWTARVPIYAYTPDANDPSAPAPFFFVKNGQAVARATNVGQEWNYRSHIEGETSDTAVWYFEFDPKLVENLEEIRFGCTFDIFKTTKGNPSRPDDEQSGVFCLMQFIDAENSKATLDSVFRVNDNRTTEVVLDVRQINPLKNGKMRVLASCLTRNQFLGMAKHDLYILAGEKSFEWNFIKGLGSLWLRVFFLTGIATAASTFLNGFVTIFLTIAVYVVGIFHDFLVRIATTPVPGGGTLESAYRLATQSNQVTDLDPGVFNDLAKTVDPVINQALTIVGAVIPDLSTLDTASFVANGFDIPFALFARNVIVVVAYVIPVVVVGHLLFRSREMASE